jgi:hypothetical protein
MESRIKRIQNDHMIAFQKEMDRYTGEIIKANEENVMELIGKDLFDYSTMGGGGKRQWGGYTLIDGEIIIKSIEWTNNSTTRSSYLAGNTYITNYSTVISVLDEPYSRNTSYYKPYVSAVKFWLPIDYIEILAIHLRMGNNLDRNGDQGVAYTTLLQSLKIKTNNGYYVKNNVDIKHMDVYKYDQQVRKDSEEVKEKTLELNARENTIIEKELMLNKMARKLKIKENQLRATIAKFKEEKETFKKLQVESENIDDIFDEFYE